MTTDEFMRSQRFHWEESSLRWHRQKKDLRYVVVDQITATEMHATYLRGQLSEASDVLAGYKAALKGKPEETKHVFKPLVEILEKRIATLTTELEGLSKEER